MNSIIDYSLFIFIIINVLVIANFDKIKFFRYILDKPDRKKKLHQKQMPLAGGIILITNILLYFIIVKVNGKYLSTEIFFNNMFDLYVFIFTSFIIFCIGLFDDKYNLSPNYKFLFLFIVIFLALIFDDNLIITTIKISFFDKVINLKQFSLLFTCFCFLVFLNAFNMFDGINLQASFYSIIILIFITIMYINSLFITILLIFFICYSFLNYKNKSFLGDNGSLLIAFLIGYIFIKLYNNDKIIFVDEVFIYMMIPGLDLIRLVFNRIINKKNPLRGDRNHLHHLISAKFSLFKSTLIVQFLIFLPLILLYVNIEPIFIILTTICCYALLIYKVKKTS
jgi:UDP-GlcNAc:undecaprenyl-phosphate/decaprenyl-phosphate GlcNAc-1-phosphate transferase